MSQTTHFTILLSRLLNDRPLEEITEPVASATHWYVLSNVLRENVGTSRPGIYKWEGWWWRISLDGPKDQPHTYIRKVEFLGRNKPA